MLIFSPFVYLLSMFGIIYGCYLVYFREDQGDQRYQLLFWMSAPAVILFTITEGPPYWAGSGHFISLIAVSGALSLLLSLTSRRFATALWRPGFVLLFILPSLVLTMGTTIIAGGDRMHNEWESLAEKIGGIRGEIAVEDVYLAGSYYFIPSEIAFYDNDEFEGYTLAFQA
ncbi:MAG: hypothetical protein SWK76_05925 [Actinomycetota bacterium]|nr:hypothetical protein [Actinomycetota bacterium]